MKYLPIFLLIFVCVMLSIPSGNAQETQKVNRKSKNPDAREVFYVIKGTDTKHGEYSRTLKGTPSIEEKGQFENGKKAGIWEYFDPTGAVEQKYDFNKNELVYNKYENKPALGITNSAIIENGKLKKNNTGQLPVLLGGMSKHHYYLANNLQYPAKARAAKIEGTVIISVTITQDGKIIDEKVEGEAGYGLGEEALRVIKLFPDEWIPLYINGNPVDTRLFIPIRFKLS